MLYPLKLTVDGTWKVMEDLTPYIVVFFSVLLTNMSLNTSYSPVTLENGHNKNQTQPDHGKTKMTI